MRGRRCRARIKGGGGWPGKQYGLQIKKTEKPRERTKAFQGVVREVFAPKKTFTDNYIRGAVAQRYMFSARFLQMTG